MDIIENENSSLIRRLKKDLNDMRLSMLSDQSSYITLIDQQNKILLCITPMVGSYSGVTFKITMYFTNQYPFEPPTLFSNIQMAHSNINRATLEVCVKILDKQHWLPTMNLYDCIKATKNTILYEDLTYVPKINLSNVITEENRSHTSSGKDSYMKVNFGIQEQQYDPSEDSQCDTDKEEDFTPMIKVDISFKDKKREFMW